MKKIFILLFIAFLAVVCCLYVSDKSSHKSASWGSFTPEKTYSYDHKFFAQQTVQNDMVVVSIYNSETNELTATFSPARAFDFWGICWEKDTYNIWTQSADIGIYCYMYKDGAWKLDNNANLPKYIISKYDKTYSENIDMQKNIYVSPTD